MSNKTKSTVAKVGLVALVCAVIAIGAYYSTNNRPQNESLSPAEPASLQQEQEQGKTLYVSADGNDTNPGTQESPKCTVGAAIDAAGTTGDKIVTKPKSTTSTSGG